MAQSNVILFCLVVAFLVFITLRGELPKYLALIFETAPSGSGGSGGSGGSSDAPASVGEALNDPVGALTGSIRRGLGVGNGLLPNLGSIGSALGGLF
jgi:hypothetical protein